MNATKIILRYLKTEASSNPKYYPNRKKFGFYLDDMLVSCTYAGLECTSSDFTTMLSFDYGNCYTFNSGYNSTIKKSSAAGGINGLEIELFSGDPNEELFIYQRGFNVIIHNQSYSPLIDNEGVFVSTGAETNIGFERSFYSKQPYPFSNCIVDPSSNKSFSSDLYQLILNKIGEKTYRQKYCFEICYQTAVVNNCSCYDPQYPNTNSSLFVNNLDYCLTIDDLFCMNLIKLYFAENGFTKDCSNSCPVECVSVSYAKYVHAAKYPTERYLNLLLKQTKLIKKFSNYSQSSPDLENLIKNSVAKINVFYNEISYKALIESPSLTLPVMLGKKSSIILAIIYNNINILSF
jgi:hypothetical protein